MNLLGKFKETFVSVFPVMAIVLFLGLTFVPLEKLLLVQFVISGFLLIIGLTIFLLGVDLGISPIGERAGAELTKKRNITLLLIVAFFIGFIVTVAEPDIQVFANQVKCVFPFLNKLTFTIMIGIGVGIFIMVGLLRSILNISIKIVLFISYLLLFTIMFLAPQDFIGIAFDSGGATTGPMTVPFIMALGLGVSTVRSDNKNSFGLTGVTSIGPILAIIIYSIILQVNGSLSTTNLNDILIQEENEICLVQNVNFISQVFLPIKNSTLPVFKESLITVLPLCALFIIFQITLLKMTKRQVLRIIIGLVYSYIGLSIFLIGVNSGFMQTGQALGEELGALANTNGGWWYVLLIGSGLAFGAIIVCAEPAVWCLSEQVEQVSGGTIKRKVLLIFLAIGTAFAIGLAMWRAVAGFNLKWILIPGYSIALILMIFSPSMFSGIAFDSGGVASGPLTSSFVLSFTIGASNSCSGSTDSFGVIALVAMMPLIAIQVMGIIFKIKEGGSQ